LFLFLHGTPLLERSSPPRRRFSCLSRKLFYLFVLAYRALQSLLPSTIPSSPCPFRFFSFFSLTFLPRPFCSVAFFLDSLSRTTFFPFPLPFPFRLCFRFSSLLAPNFCFLPLGGSLCRNLSLVFPVPLLFHFDVCSRCHFTFYLCRSHFYRFVHGIGQHLFKTLCVLPLFAVYFAFLIPPPPFYHWLSSLFLPFFACTFPVNFTAELRLISSLLFWSL